MGRYDSIISTLLGILVVPFRKVQVESTGEVLWSGLCTDFVHDLYLTYFSPFGLSVHGSRVKWSGR